MGFILQVQGSANLFDSAKLAPTGSGSSDWHRKLNIGVASFGLPFSNVRQSASFRQLLESEAVRELQEESRLKLRLADKRNIEITGYSRSMERALKPDFFMFLYLPDNYVDSENQIRNRVRVGKELLFVDDIVMDFFAFAFKWSEQIEARYLDGSADERAKIKLEMRAYVQKLVDQGKAYNELADEIKAIISDEDLAILLENKEGRDRSREYWCLLLKMMTVMPKAGSALRVTCACLLERIDQDAEFAKQFDPDVEVISSEGGYVLLPGDPHSD